MKLVLLERIEKLGSVGDIVNVKTGYARNFLLPLKKALRATKENMAVYEERKAELAKLDEKRKSEATALAKKMADVCIILIRQASETGMLYGSVTGRDIAESLKEQGFKIERPQIDLNVPFKAIGVFQVSLSLHPDVRQAIKVVIARSDDEAKVLMNPPAEKTEEKTEKKAAAEKEKKSEKTPSGRKKTAKKEETADEE